MINLEILKQNFDWHSYIPSSFNKSSIEEWNLNSPVNFNSTKIDFPRLLFPLLYSKVYGLKIQFHDDF